MIGDAGDAGVSTSSTRRAREGGASTSGAQRAGAGGSSQRDRSTARKGPPSTAGAGAAAAGAIEDLREGDDATDDVSFSGGFSIPSRIYTQLFPYQQVGVKWLWELHTQRAGGALPLFSPPV